MYKTNKKIVGKIALKLNTSNMKNFLKKSQNGNFSTFGKTPEEDYRNQESLALVEKSYQNLFTGILLHFNSRADKNSTRPYPYENTLEDNIFVARSESSSPYSLGLICFVGEIRISKSKPCISDFECNLIEILLSPLCYTVHADGSHLVNFKNNDSFECFKELFNNPDVASLLNDYLNQIDINLLEEPFDTTGCLRDFKYQYFTEWQAANSGNPSNPGERQFLGKCLVTRENSRYVQLAIFFRLLFKLMLLNDLNNDLRLKMNYLLKKAFNSTYQMPRSKPKSI